MLTVRPRSVLALVAVLALTAALWAQSPKIEPDQKYLLLATTRTSTMQKELDAAAAQGFRIVVGAPTSGTEMVVLLERVTTPAEPFQYKLLATTQTTTMQKELDAAAKEGYRLLPRTMIAKPGFLSVEILVILEKAPKSISTSRWEYKLLATTRTSTLQKEITENMKQGFVIAGMVSRGEHMVIMEKEIKAEGTGAAAQ